MSIIKLALRKYIKIKDLSTFKNPLFIGPHPDDIEFGCGALISKLKEKNADIHFVIVTDGAAGSKDPKIDSKTLKQIRTSEAKEASSYLGVSTIDFLEFMDGGSYEIEDVIKKLCPYILKYKPDIIFSPDPNLSTECHIDHLKVSSAFRDASQILLYQNSLLSHGVSMEGLSPLDNPPFIAYYFTDRPNHYEKVNKKNIDDMVNALHLHKSQMEGGGDALITYFKLKMKVNGLKHFKGNAMEFRVLHPLVQHCYSSGE